MLSQVKKLQTSKLFAFDFKERFPINGETLRIPSSSKACLRQVTNGTTGWEIYDIQKEYQRMGVNRSPRWRVSNLNVIYGVRTIVASSSYIIKLSINVVYIVSQMCESYPNYVVCPSTITDEVLDAVARYRSRGRLPALSWIHPTNEGTRYHLFSFD